MRSASIALALMALGAAASADECIKTHNKVFSELGQNGGASYQARGRRPGRPAAVAEASVARDQGLSRSAFERVVEGRHEQLEHCFQRRLASGRAVDGDLELTVTIGADGSVLRAGVSTAQHDRPLEQCLSQVVSRWRFPRAGAAATFRLPLVFDVGDLQSRR